MKRALCLLFAAMLLLSLCACASGVESDYAVAIQVDGTIYLLPAQPSPAEIDPAAIIGYTQSYTDAFPDEDWEQNFSRELNQPVAKVEDGVAVMHNNEWHICAPME